MWFLYRLAVTFICFLAAILSAVFMYIRFSQNRYVTGKEIPAEKKAMVKQRYILTPLFLLGFGIYTGFFWNAPVQNVIPVDRPVAKEADDPVKPGMAFEDFKTAYNKNADEILNETIPEWSITDGEKADTAKFSGEGYSFLVMLSNDDVHHVTGVMFLFQLTPEDADFMMNNFRMYALILTIEPNTTVDEAAQFLSQLAESSGAELTTRSGAKYTFQNVQGNIVLTVIL